MPQLKPMRHAAATTVRALVVAAALIAPTAAFAACPPVLNHSFPTLQGERPTSLCDYAGKVVLVVNTASKCGFTDQYEGLEALQRTRGAEGLVVLGFPANDFGSQEPGSNQEIAEFCRSTYGVQFPMFAKSRVIGRDANPLFASLAATTGQPPQWNFHKYLIDRSGTRVVSFGSRVRPDDPRLMAQLESFLAAR
ncbi:MAG TPA: glutathione peroxidase [Rhodocyclaceae bacterium]